MPPRYLFDRFADQLATNAERAVAGARGRLQKPLRRVVFWKDASETLIPQEVALFSSGTKSDRYQDADVVVALARPRTAIPGHIDLAREEGWTDALDLFRQLLSRELHRALAAVTSRETVTRFLGDPDCFERLLASPRGRNPRDRHIRRALAAAGADGSNVRALSERCYADRTAQSWLIGLAPKARKATASKETSRSSVSPRWKRYFMARTSRVRGKEARETLYFEILGNKVILYVDCKYVSEHPKTRAAKLIAERERDGWKKLEIE